jgi:hypothetical protein
MLDININLKSITYHMIIKKIKMGHANNQLIS